MCKSRINYSISKNKEFWLSRNSLWTLWTITYIHRERILKSKYRNILKCGFHLGTVLLVSVSLYIQCISSVANLHSSNISEILMQFIIFTIINKEDKFVFLKDLNRSHFIFFKYTKIGIKTFFPCTNKCVVLLSIWQKKGKSPPLPSLHFDMVSLGAWFWK